MEVKNKMKRKIVFLDLDGTLFDVPRGLYEPTIKTRETISKLKKNGHLVFICSGRCKCLLDDFIKSLDVSGFVLGNGTYCEMNNEVLFNDMFNEDIMDNMCEYIINHDGVPFCEGQEYIYVPDLNNSLFRLFVDSWHINDQIFKDKKTANNFNMMMAAFKREADRRAFSLHFKNQADITNQYGFISVDINRLGANKGNAIKRLLKHLDISYKDAYAFGDGLNDIEMMEAVYNSYAMDNACERLKEVARFKAPDVLNDGFYKTMLKEKLVNE